MKASIDLLDTKALQTHKRTFANTTRLARVVRIVDGDTLDVSTYLRKGEAMCQYRVRIIGIDTPETRTRNPKEKEAGENAKAALGKFIRIGSMVWIEFRGEDMYGREIGRVFTTTRGANRKFTRNVDIGKMMVSMGFGKEYSGKGARPTWTPQDWEVVARMSLDDIPTS